MMRLDTLSLSNFRNYTQQDFHFADGVNIICGQNAQGKTNLLEAIAALSTMRLFRTAQKKEGLRFGQEQGKIMGRFYANQRDFTMEIRLFRRKSLEIYRNDVRMKRQADAVGTLQTVLFCPDDLLLIREGAGARRRFIDTALCQLRPKYAQALWEYQKLLEHKTRILRDSEEKPSLLELLDDFTLRMAGFAAQLIRQRALFIRALTIHAQEIHRDIAGNDEKLTLAYQTVSTIDDPYASASQIARQVLAHSMQHRSAEIAARSCLSGPHKDDLFITINEQRAAAFGSQGQVRTCALALKLAERTLFYEDSKEYPLLLLDDVLSELDRRRQDFVLNHIAGGQVFITCCEEALLQRVKNGKIFKIYNGQQC